MNLDVSDRFVVLMLLSVACSHPRPEPGSVLGGEQPQGRSGYVAGEGGVRLFYRVEGQGPDTLVVLHGGPGLNIESLRPDLGPLARHHTLLYFDQRGSGQSEMPDTLQLTGAAMVEDVEAVRRAFRLDRLSLFGHSWGGGLAVLYAAQYPDRVKTMVLVGPAAPRWHPYLDQYNANIAVRHDTIENARSAALDSIQKIARDPHPACHEWFRIFLRGVAATPAAASRIKGDCAGTSTNLRLFGVLNQRIWASLVNTPDSDGYDWRGMATRVMARTLVVHGDKDPLPLSASEEWVRVLPAARLLVIRDAGHYPHAEQPDQFFPAVEDFLTKHGLQRGDSSK